MISEERDEELNQLAKMVWDFQIILARKLYNPNDKAEFQAELNENIDPDTFKPIISETHRPNYVMQKISISVNFLPIYVLEGMRLIRIS